MARAGTQFAARFNREWLAHSIRTTFAAIMSLYIARLAGLPEAYWATITTLIVMQSTLGAALTPSRQRFVGTALGAAAGALMATYFGASTIVYTPASLCLGWSARCCGWIEAPIALRAPPSRLWYWRRTRRPHGLPRCTGLSKCR